MSADSPSEPNYLGLGLYRLVLELDDPVRDLNDPVRELNDPVRELNDPVRDLNDPAHDLIDPARELNYLALELNHFDLELELFLKEPEESSISIRCLNLFKLLRTSNGAVNRIWNLSISSFTDIRSVNPPFWHGK